MGHVLRSDMSEMSRRPPLGRTTPRWSARVISKMAVAPALVRQVRSKMSRVSVFGSVSALLVLLLGILPDASAQEEAPEWIESPHTVGEATFNERFQQSANGIIRIARDGTDFAFYKRLGDDQSTFQPYFFMMNNWFSA